MNTFERCWYSIITSKPSVVYLSVFLILSTTTHFNDNLTFKIIILGLMGIISFLFGFYFGISVQKNFGDKL